MRFKATDLPHERDAFGTETFAQFTDFIYEACMQHTLEIGTHKQGCCVMQRCLEKGLRRQKLMLSSVIVNQIAGLIEDQFGNYLV